MRFAIIGGTGFYEAGGPDTESVQLSTAYGEVEVDIFRAGNEEVAFLTRHGKKHGIAPHLINYRANIAALKSLGVENILASATVGSLNPRIIPGKFALPTQFLDFTHGRAATFFDQEVVKHVDVTEPYCPSLRPALIELAMEGNIVLHPGATYVCTQGPRFETPAEIEMFRRLGGDLAGMTGVPEVVLAREANICYATVALVTNWAAGMAGKSISHVECSEFGKEHIPIMRELFLKLIAAYPKNDCACRHAIR